MTSGEDECLSVGYFSRTTRMSRTTPRNVKGTHDSG